MDAGIGIESPNGGRAEDGAAAAGASIPLIPSGGGGEGIIATASACHRSSFVSSKTFAGLPGAGNSSDPDRMSGSAGAASAAGGGTRWGDASGTRDGGVGGNGTGNKDGACRSGDGDGGDSGGGGCSWGGCNGCGGCGGFGGCSGGGGGLKGSWYRTLANSDS